MAGAVVVWGGGVACAGIEAPKRELGDCDVVYQLETARLSGVVYPGQHGQGGRRSGMARGVAIVPAVPGLAPRGFYGSGGGVARVISPACAA